MVRAEGDRARRLELLQEQLLLSEDAGAAAPTPWRTRAAEAVLTGKTIDAGLAAEAGRAALEGATPLSGNAYKAPIFEALVKRAILAAAA